MRSSGAVVGICCLAVAMAACVDPLSQLLFQHGRGLHDSIKLRPIAGQEIEVTIGGTSSTFLVFVNRDSTAIKCRVAVYGGLKAKKGLGDASFAPNAIEVWFENVQMTRIAAEQWTKPGADSTKERSFDVHYECNPLESRLVWLDSVRLAPATIRIVPKGLFTGTDGPIQMDTIVAQMREITRYSDYISQRRVASL